MAKGSKPWLSEIERMLTIESFVMHIDEVLGPRYAPKEAVRQSLDLYHELIRAVSPRANEWVATVVIPLHFDKGERWSNKMDRRVPPFSKWQSEWATEEPPSIGIYRRSLLLQVDNVEEYRCPIVESVLPIAIGQIDCYYRVWDPRSLDEVPREYSRAVYLEYHGPAPRVDPL